MWRPAALRFADHVGPLDQPQRQGAFSRLDRRRRRVGRDVTDALKDVAGAGVDVLGVVHRVLATLLTRDSQVQFERRLVGTLHQKEPGGVHADVVDQVRQ